MTITDFTPWTALLGGILIGTASALALALNGKIPGISGLCSRILRAESGDTAMDTSRRKNVHAGRPSPRRAPKQILVKPRLTCG